MSSDVVHVARVAFLLHIFLSRPMISIIKSVYGQHKVRLDESWEKRFGDRGGYG